jgi:hypothetical protein
MVPTEHAVERLRGHLTEILDDADADTLVSVFDTSDLATKTDLAILKQELIAAFRGEINTAPPRGGLVHLSWAPSASACFEPSGDGRALSGRSSALSATTFPSLPRSIPT